MDDLNSPLESEPSRRWSRRRVILSAIGGAGALAAGGAGYVFRIEPHWVELVDRPMTVSGLPPAWDGKTLLQLSDLHVGSVVDDEYLIRSLDRAAAQQPDAVVLTGDSIHEIAAADGQLERILKHVPEGTRASVAILGNHDYGRGWSETVIADRVAGALRDRGFTVLRNTSTDVDGLVISGLEDFWSPNWNRNVATDVIRNDRPAIVLCHNPDACDVDIWSNQREDGGFRGWILSGHTHGGQVSIPFWGPPLLPVKNRRYTSGEFDLAGGRTLYINRALGYLRRVRFGVRPEMTLFRLAVG